MLLLQVMWPAYGADEVPLASALSFATGNTGVGISTTTGAQPAEACTLASLRAFEARILGLAPASSVTQPRQPSAAARVSPAPEDVTATPRAAGPAARAGASSLQAAAASSSLAVASPLQQLEGGRPRQRTSGTAGFDGSGSGSGSGVWDIDDDVVSTRDRDRSLEDGGRDTSTAFSSFAAASAGSSEALFSYDDGPSGGAGQHSRTQSSWSLTSTAHLSTASPPTSAPGSFAEGSAHLIGGRAPGGRAVMQASHSTTNMAERAARQAATSEMRIAAAVAAAAGLRPEVHPGDADVDMDGGSGVPAAGRPADVHYRAHGPGAARTATSSRASSRGTGAARP